MAELFASRSSLGPLTITAVLTRVGMLGLPVGFLLAATLRSPGEANLILWVGTAFQTAAWILSCSNRTAWSRPLGPSVVTLYLTALTWIWFGDTVEDWYNHLAKAILIVIPLLVFGHLMLHESGAVALRRANGLAERLANRQ